ncbi:methylated-DNA-[protein]-cysteine S-methyltransferase [Rhodococcus sp. SMB37]|uniref:methylated-DNA--[protein]-cysteine S-methyltransferase n=1 Tax=Rhodococcus sp. SMB37 TaxID=2512213 RepID=UPI0006CF71FE|nr:methylated-DNA--[protein]-cysteine S-methyltransferase [Rhodococcus sp. SMB37]TCN41597.1 methylated-DNA-[protein]-cysteine S-methyltransferase [Rhodococcus sp. SMB37]
MTSYALFDTALGRCAVVWREDGVAGFQLPESSDAATTTRLRDLFPDAAPIRPGPLARRVIDGVTALLGGEPDPLTDVDLDLTGLPDFDRRVYAVTRAIEPGRTRTYGDVAAAIGSPGSAQAVGQALGRNPIPILVPCHRVLAAHGALGGFSASGGTVTKRALLAAEGTPGFDDPTLF